MDIQDLIFNRAGRPRSLWRVAAFVVAFLVVFIALRALMLVTLGTFLSGGGFDRLLDGYAGWAVQSVFFIFVPAALAGWACGLVLEDLPWRALGWALHRGWARDLLLGVLLGAVSLGVAALVGAAFGGYRLALNDSAQLPLILKTLASSALILMLGAAAEEMLFRGYPLQTLMRSWPVWGALILSTAAFAFVHMENPNVVPGFTFVNTFLAGVWLAVAYWRTRSLWFPFGLHWGWNWTMGALLGSPISGITTLAPDPLLRFESGGPAWLGGGAYGVEGGAACTLAIALSTAYIWRTRLLSATEELRRFTDEENPDLPSAPLSNYLASPEPPTPPEAPTGDAEGLAEK
jgi:membrane protease YdiL (CAAX protease family)